MSSTTNYNLPILSNEGGLSALKGINLSIPVGSFYGLLGPNGAGKTTTIGIITGLVNITSGSVSIMATLRLWYFINAKAKCTAKVVFPVPPFCCEIVMTLESIHL